MDIVSKINGLNGQVVDRKALQEMLEDAHQNDQLKAAKRIANILETYPDETSFEIELEQPFFEELPAYILQALPEDQTDENFTGLNKAVSPDEIYQYITDLIIDTIKTVGHLPWQMTWEKTSIYNGYQALNFDTKKGYRGINFWLTNFEVKQTAEGREMVPRDLSNPYFLTFNQIVKHKGKLKEGSKGTRVVYFTKLYHYKEKQKDGSWLEFGSYNKKKFLAWIIKNQHKLEILKRSNWSVERLAESYIPILKYYNIYAGKDIEGIDWGVLPRNENADQSESKKIEICESIVNSMPQAPEIIYKGDQPAYYPQTDNILMTPIDAFNSPQEYYTTLFHELVHSTGHRSRLSRPEITLGNLATKRDRAFEELIAEMGAIFLSSEAGILFKTLHNSAKYLAGWNSRLVKNMKEDNRFFFRASSRSQAAADFILNRDKEGLPAYLKQLTEKNAESENKDEQKEIFDFSDPKTYKSDFTYEELKRSYYWVSFDPEKRAKRELEAWPGDFVTEYNRLKDLAIENNKDLDLLNDLFARFHKRILNLKKNVVSIRSQMASAAITGPAKFPTAKQNKIHDRHHDAYGEYFKAWKKGLNKIESKLFNREVIVSGSSGAIEKLESRLEALQKINEAQKFFNKNLMGKKSTDTEKQMFFDQQNLKEAYKTAYPTKSGQMADWRIKDAMDGGKLVFLYMSRLINETKKKIEFEKRRNSNLENNKKEYSFEGGTVVYNDEANRIQIIYDEKPDDATRKELKKNGFRWSPKFSAWQRQLTNAGIVATRRLLNLDLGLLGENPGLNLPVEILHNKKEAKKFFINWAQKNLVGEKVFLPQINKQVQFDLKAISANIKGGMSIPMASLITQAEQLLKRASLEGKKAGGSKAKVIYTLRSTGHILTVETPVKFTLVEKKNGNVYFTHNVSDLNKKEAEKRPELSFEVVPVQENGKMYFAPYVNNLRIGATNWDKQADAKNELSRFTRLFTEKEIWQQIKDHGQKPGALNIPAETKPNQKKSQGLKQPVLPENEIQPENPAEPIKPVEKPTRSRNTVAANINRGAATPLEFYVMPDPEIAKFLDNIEIKPKESVVITIAGEKGSGKTHAIFKWINAFAQNYNVGHASLEEHPESYLYRQKAEKYFNDRAMNTVEAPDITTVAQLDDLIKNNDVIFIDSFAKLQEIQSRFEVDKDLRKKYDGKLFVVIFQQTSNGKMRGGSKSEFDGDVILYTEKFSDFRENYIYTEKNRYTSKSIDGLQYNIFNGVTTTAEDNQEDEPEPKKVEETKNNPASRLVATLV